MLNMNIKTIQVESSDFISKDEFQNFIKINRKPLLLKNLNIGDCVKKWNVNYLASTLGKIEVKIHVCPVGCMNFLNKNFIYKTLPFDDFIKRCSGDNDDNKFILCENEVYYLRSIGFDKRGKDIADIRKQFPQISNDIKFPEIFDERDFFSSVFRIASPGVQIWTHYDVMDNVLLQISGVKKVVLFSPLDVNNLYMKGDKSEILNITTPDYKKYPKFVNALHYKCTLYPGDALFIPSLWFHNILCETFSIGVNVFWKNIDHTMYDKNDAYGNKDPLPASKALLHINKAIESLKALPKEYNDFYIRRCISSLHNELQQSESDDNE